MTRDSVYRERATAMANMLTTAPQRHNQKVYGAPKEPNECGTTACIAGWATLARKGIVTIELNGTMIWDEKDLGPVATKRSEYRWDFAPEELATPTLWRARFQEHAEHHGAAWLGLSRDAAFALFQTTVRCETPNAAAVAVLRRLADGRLDRDFHLTARDMDRMVAEDTAVSA